MDLELSDDQFALRDGIRALLEGRFTMSHVRDGFDRATGLLAPGAVQLADVSGDGIKDLIIANSGSNNVLIYPGLGDGQFGDAVNGGHGFFTGTNPAGITLADVNDDKKPDLVIANKGSNDVSILINQSSGNNITFSSTGATGSSSLPG